jgi:hypothetical protein
MYTFPFVPFRYSKTLTIGVLILLLCLIPSSEFSRIEMPITFTDIIVHFIMFLGFSWALYLDLTRKRSEFKIFRFIAIAVLVSFGLGVVTELLQVIITPLNRSGSFGDLMSDFGGSICGSLAAAFIRRRSSVAP